jgi:TetR/AcrR family transcriptional repressor of mexAB-oprM operon
LDYIDQHSQWLSSIQAPTCEGRQSLIYQSQNYKFFHSTLCELLNEKARSTEKLSKDSAFTADAILASLTPNFYLFLRQERAYTKEEIKIKLNSLYID